MSVKNFFTYAIGIVLLTISYGAAPTPHGNSQSLSKSYMIDTESYNSSFDLYDLGTISIAKHYPDRNDPASRCIGRNLCIGDQYLFRPSIPGDHPAYGYAGVVWRVGEIDLGNGQFAYLGLAYPDSRPSFSMLMYKDIPAPTGYTVSGYGEMNAPDPLTLSYAINDSKSVVSKKEDKSSSKPYYCNQLSSGCGYNFAFFMNDSSPDPHLYIRLPRKFSADSGDVSFNVSLLDLLYKSAEGDSYRTVSLNINGTISLAQRCYAYIDGDSNQQTIEFKDVKANAVNGAQEVKSLQLKSSCDYPPQDLLRTVKIVPIRGATLSYDNKVLFFDPDERFQYTFGFIFRINGTPDCSSSSNDEYNYNVLSQYAGRENDKVTWEDTLNIALCKYGIPKSPGGERDVVINVQTEWRY
ncbi:hypothetical protein [Providencia rettgeri]|uniref:hypothetical protein n=1 Tax=Providencia rettgeri TaxID=587 RepID=UPI0015EC8E2F|nr:hypothetical protein H0913_07150 [Providencia rettgeri]